MRGRFHSGVLEILNSYRASSKFNSTESTTPDRPGLDMRQSAPGRSGLIATAFVPRRVTTVSRGLVSSASTAPHPGAGLRFKDIGRPGGRWGAGDGLGRR